MRFTREGDRVVVDEFAPTMFVSERILRTRQRQPVFFLAADGELVICTDNGVARYAHNPEDDDILGERCSFELIEGIIFV